MVRNTCGYPKNLAYFGFDTRFETILFFVSFLRCTVTWPFEIHTAPISLNTKENIIETPRAEWHIDTPTGLQSASEVMRDVG